jgi:hypothetical protein
MEPWHREAVRPLPRSATASASLLLLRLWGSRRPGWLEIARGEAFAARGSGRAAAVRGGAAMMDVSRQSVSEWARAHRLGRDQALRASGGAGRVRRRRILPLALTLSASDAVILLGTPHIEGMKFTPSSIGRGVVSSGGRRAAAGSASSTDVEPQLD